MDYPWNDDLIIEAAPKDDTTIEDTGTNEPVTTPADEQPVDEQPDPSLAEDLAGSGDLQAQIDELKKQLDDLLSQTDLEVEIEKLKKRVDNIDVQDDTDLNDAIFQSASREIKYVKRAIRRLNIDKKSALSGEQQQKIINELEQTPELSCQEIAAKLAPAINASEQDIFDFIRNSDYRFRHRHFRESSVIDWDVID